MTALMHRVGRICANHALVVLMLWVIAAIALAAAVHIFGAQTNNDLSLPGTDSQAADDVLAKRFPPQQNGTSPIVFYTSEGSLADKAHKSAMSAAIKNLRHTEHVYSVLSPVSSKGQSAGILSKDKATGYAPVLLDVDSGSVDEDLAQQILDAARTPALRAGIEVEAGGSIGSRLSEPKTESSEVVGLTAAIIILTLVLGSLIAMGLPILTAVFALVAALSTIGLMGHVFGVPSIAPTVATMIGLGVGIDYSLFLVTRHADQLRSGMGIRESIANSVATSGSAILFAGGTVVIALLCLVVADIPLVTAIGFSSAVAVIAAVMGALTLLPALLSLVGERIHWLALPAFLHRRPTSRDGGMWASWSYAVSRHPWLAIGGSLLVLTPLIIPMFSLELGQEDISVAPESTTERKAYDLVTNGLGVGYNGPLLIAGVLRPPAQPSSQFKQQYHTATRLKKELKQEKKSLTAQANELKAEKQKLKEQQRSLNTQADELQTEQTSLLDQKAALQEQESDLKRRQQELLDHEAQLDAEKASLTKQGKALATEIERTAAALVVVNAHKQLLRDRIKKTTNPVRLQRLQDRLARVQQRESLLRERAHLLKHEARQLARQAEHLERQGQRLQQQGDELQQQANELQRQAARLTAQGDQLQSQAAALQRQGDALQQQADALQQQADHLKAQKKKAKQQQQHAENLQKKLTKELTQAGGDKRATDPRVVNLQDALLATPGVVALTPPQISTQGDALILNAIPDTAPASDETASLVKDLRADILPAATSEGGLVTHVGGYTASYVDLAAKISDRLLLVVATVLALSFLLLMLAFRSLLVPVQAAIMNLLSVAASFGVLTATFQWGWGLSIVGLDAPSGTVPIASYVPLMMFAILFGLSMDYEVFLVSHIVAFRNTTISPREQVRIGLAGSARVISAAALIMICVFGSFILNGDPTVKQFGVGLAVAVLLAASLVLVLAPALLTLFGRFTWLLPPMIDRLLPDIGLDESGDLESPA